MVKIADLGVIKDYTYDDNGNLTQRVDGADTTSFDWSFDNRLTEITYPDSSSDSFVPSGTSGQLRQRSPPRSNFPSPSCRVLEGSCERWCAVAAAATG